MFYPVYHTARLGHLTFLLIMSPRYFKLMLLIMQRQMRMLCVLLRYLISSHAEILYKTRWQNVNHFFHDISHFLVCTGITCECCICKP